MTLILNIGVLTMSFHHTHKLKINLNYFLLLFLLFSNFLVHAADNKKQYYHVELVLFQHLNKQGQQEEFWHQPPINSTNSSTYDNNESLQQNDIQAPQHVINNSLALAEYDLSTHIFTSFNERVSPISTENYQLTDTANHIRYSDDYKLLAHFGWAQRSLSKKQALPINIIAKSLSDNTQLIPVGELTLYISRYLHLQVDLQATQCLFSSSQKREQEDNSCVNQLYQFKQDRKMRSGELHYIDNPVFGLLVYVTPFKANY
jgi:hypothetical protein